MSEASMEDALRPFGWTCGPEFWRRFHSDAWVFHLANAVERQADEIERLRSSLRRCIHIAESSTRDQPLWSLPNNIVYEARGALRLREISHEQVERLTQVPTTDADI